MAEVLKGRKLPTPGVLVFAGEKSGGDDGARTRDLRRDRPAF
jgi:hypothetical protein